MHSPRRDSAVMNDAARVSWDYVQVSRIFLRPQELRPCYIEEAPLFSRLYVTDICAN